MPRELDEPDPTGSRELAAEGFYQATAMLDKGELLGELAQLAEVPNTRANVEAETPIPKGCRLIIVAGPDIGTEWAFKQPEVVIGRDEECELHMADIAVSRRHAKIALEGDRFFLVDFGSGNGTFLNGVRIEREALASGDEIVIGERTLRFVELNEAPPTGAAHPVPILAPEPRVGDAPNAVGSSAKEPSIGKASQVDVGVVPTADGPGASEGKIEDPAEVDAARPKGAKPGAALNRAVAVLGVIAFLCALAFSAFLYHRHVEEKRAVEARLTLSKREFLQGIELVKALRFGDALALFNRVLEVRPDYARAAEYKAHCERELGVWGVIEAARALAGADKHAEAIDKLLGIPSGSAYQALIEALKAEWAKTIALGLLREAKSKLDAGDLDAALDLAMEALQRSPALASAQALRDEIEDAKREANKPRKKKEEIPPLMMRAVALYKNEQIGAAIDAAEAAGGPDAATYVARMKRVKVLLQDGEVAHKKKAAAELLRICPAALEVDQQISLGDGKVRTKLKRFYADGLYLKGIEAYAEKDFVRSYRLLSDAVEQQPGHALSETRLAELSRKARDLYYEGYVLKDSDPGETRKIFKRLVQMTKSDNQYHKLAAQWLAANGGG